jgi:RHS repeat-associated protein
LEDGGEGKGKVEIVLDTPVTARFIKVKSMFDERDNLLNPVNQAQFMNTPQDLIHVYYLMNTRQEEYSYDKIGNRLSETVTQRYPVSRTYVYYPNTSRLKSNGKYNFEYDSNGNLVKKETLIGEKIVWKYEYDLFNRLVKVTKNDSVVAGYTYDEAGLRIKKQGPQSQIYYVFDSGGNVLYEQENREYMEYMEYVYVLGKHFARVDGNLDNSITKKYFYHTDHLGSTVLITDEQGQQVWSAEFTPFGKQVSKEGELDHAAKFTGKDLDEDTGLYYFNARWYDEEVGRFITEDSIPIDPNDPRTLNYYTYAFNNPIYYNDPTGHLPEGANPEELQAEIDAFWSNPDNFTGNEGKWWQDQGLQMQALLYLQWEMELNGSSSFIRSSDQNIDPHRIQAIQAALGVTRTGTFDMNTYNRTEDVQTSYNINNASGGTIGTNTIRALVDRASKKQEFYDKYPFFKFVSDVYGDNGYFEDMYACTVLGSLGASAFKKPNISSNSGEIVSKSDSSVNRFTQSDKVDFYSSFDKSMDSGINIFKGKTPAEIDQIFRNAGFEARGPDPVNGKGGYVNPKTGRSYHIDYSNSYGEPPHVDVNRAKSYKGQLDKRKFDM